MEHCKRGTLVQSEQFVIPRITSQGKHVPTVSVPHSSPLLKLVSYVIRRITMPCVACPDTPALVAATETNLAGRPPRAALVAATETGLKPTRTMGNLGQKKAPISRGVLINYLIRAAALRSSSSIFVAGNVTASAFSTLSAHAARSRFNLVAMSLTFFAPRSSSLSISSCSALRT